MLPKRFAEKIQAAQANSTLLAALEANATRRVNARARAFAALPDYPARRQRAHVVRTEVVVNLARYLGEFTKQVEANGIVVHRAQDSAEAVQIVLEIAGQNGARLIAKSKTMLGEEIEINQALQAAGLEVVETDLGEYIVQLRGERPAHIITPAVHLRRQDVARTFQEKLGVPYNDDIAVMTDLARARLRQVFLDAQIGISGVNFGVVESGTLCVVTNEGNGRMVTTLPPVHIALMGIERMVPTLEDLALMLSLLPRASSGVKMTVYASLLHGPRQPGDPDGPQQRHLVLVDNSRQQVSQGPLAEALLCIRCGACLNACPVFRELGGHAYVGVTGQPAPYPGPIGSVLTPALLGQEDFAHLARASSLCGACRDVCPVDINLPQLLLRVRAGQVKDDSPINHFQVPLPLRLGLAFFTWMATSPWRFRLAQKLAGWFGALFAPGRSWLRLPALTGWGYSKDFPRPARVTFRQRFSKISVPPATGKNVPGHGSEPCNQNRPTSSLDQLADYQQPPDLADQFSTNLVAAGGALIHCAEAELPARLVDFLRQRNIDQVLSWEAPHLPTGLISCLKEAGIQIKHKAGEEARAGLTGSLAAAVDTATLLLTGGPGRPLTASLLPEVHIAILHPSDLYANLGQVLVLPELRQAGAAALVTGPSRTSDIEMSLTIGVHGPKELVVFLLDYE